PNDGEGADRRRLVLVRNAAAGERRLGYVARVRELGLADRIELKRAVALRGDDGHGCGLDRPGQIRVRKNRESLEYREVRDRGQDAPGHDDLLTTDLVRQRPEHDEKRRPDEERRGDDQIRRHRLDLQDLFEEEERVELPAVPDDRLTRRRAEQRQNDDLEIAPFSERLGQRGLRELALRLDFQERGRFLQLQPDVDGDREQDDREQERNAPAPHVELLAHGHAAAQ